MSGLSATKKGRVKQMVLLTGLLGLGGAVLSVLYVLGVDIHCPFHLLTKLNCPGCGNTRAAMALLRLDFRGMFYYNALFPLEVAYLIRVYGMCVFRYIRHGRFAYRPRSFIGDVVVLVLLVAWTVVRNCTALF